MADKVDKTISNLEETEENILKSKDKTFKWCEDLGYQEDVVHTLKELWKDLASKKKDLPEEMVASGCDLSENMKQLSNNVFINLKNSGLDESLYTAGTAYVAASGVAISTASTAYLGMLPTSYRKLVEIVDQRSEQEKISSGLSEYSPVIADIYNNAWSNLHTTMQDKTRAPMFLIREVIRQLLDIFAPDKKVMEKYKIKKARDVHQNHKINYISDKIDNPWVRETFLKQAKAFREVYKALSKAHQPGGLMPEKTKGLLYQADELIKLLLKSQVS